MVQLVAGNVQLAVQIASKAEAIQQVGSLLVKSGFIEAGYVKSMLAREAQANTFLGNGIAIPHGQPQARDLIHKTGIAVLQAPEGVRWNPGEIVHLVVGVAAKSDEHLQILTNLTYVLDDPEQVKHLTHTDNPQDIIDQLTRSSRAATNGHQKSTDTTADFDQYVDLMITGGTGLHARPATAFVDVAKSFNAEIRVRHGEQVANGKSLMSLLKLGVEQGSQIRIMAQGDDAQQALQMLQEAVETGLEEEAEEAEMGGEDLPELVLESIPMLGISASPGIAIAPLYQHQHSQIRVLETGAAPEIEVAQLRRAIAAAQRDLKELYATIKLRLGAGKAAIFQTHQEFLADPDLVDAVIAKLPPNHSAAWIWQQEIKARADTLAAVKDPLIAGRSVDIRDVGDRVLKKLVQPVDMRSQLPDHPVILIADDLSPSDTVGFDSAIVVGCCTAKGGATSHAAIIARSLKIPAIVSAGDSILNLANGQQAVLDGNRGRLYPKPTVSDLAKARQTQQAQQDLQDVVWRSRYQPALTKDGHRIEVVANIGAPGEAEQAVNAGGEGVGLLRTEFLFLNRATPPSEDEQLTAYQTMTQALNGLPIIIRTLDIGGDKDVPYLNLPKEENPFLGVRGIRLCLHQTELFETQLRAILRAAKTGYVRVMFPMIATLEDVRAAKAFLESVREQVQAPPVEIGMMVEAPSAVLMAAEFAQEVDFFSVGTNDLTQYLLAMDRGHPVLAKQLDALHPAVLRAIAQTVAAAKQYGKWVGVCGGLASDPLGSSILAGLGVTELSMTIPSIPGVKAKLRRTSMQRLQRLAKRALRCTTAEEVRQL